MEFIVIAHDAPGVFERRMAVRERHLATIGNLKAQGHVVYAVGLLDDSEKLAGSVIVCEFESREPLDAWLREEPYVVHGVWEQIEILCCAIGPAFRAASPPAPGFSIRPASNSDAPGVLRCLSQAFARYRDEYTPDGFRDTILDEATIRHRMTAMTVLVAVDAKDTVIGTIGFAHDGEGEGHLRGMAVVPEWQGRNVAAALLQSAESQPTALGCDRITLDTTAPLRRASSAPNSCDGVKLPGRASPPRTRATAASAASTVKVYPSGTVIVIVSSAPSFATRPQRNTRAAVRSSSLGPARRTAIFCTIRLSTSLRRRGRNGRNRRSRWMLRGDAAW
jgi:uncharacterized protein YciI/N-acetylglutamate synthase-like GNAT family acetyltransferase